MSRWFKLPPHAPGQKIGLLGGSFNPAHEGHVAASLLALRRLKLDYVWWLVSPGNPLKDAGTLASLAERLADARVVSSHPRIIVTDIEAQAGTRFTFDIVQLLKQRAPTCRFVWLMGADNFISFHRWKRWQEIAELVPIAIIDRPGSTLKGSHMGKAFEKARLDETDAALLPLSPPPAYVVLHGPRSSLSSTELRESGKV